MIEYSLRAATEDDKAWLEHLRRHVYRDLFDATWGGWDESRHLRHFAEFWALGDICLILLEGNPVGVVQVTETDDVIEVNEIQVLPELQNRGVGGRVLGDVIAQAAQRQKQVRLYLGLKNQGALRLYRRLGFVETARSDTHIFMTHPAGSA